MWENSGHTGFVCSAYMKHTFHMSVKAGCIGSRLSILWYIAPTLNGEAGAVTSWNMHKRRQCHQSGFCWLSSLATVPRAALIQVVVGAFSRDSIFQLLTWQKSVTVHHTMLHLATVSKCFFTSMEILFVPVPDAPVLVVQSPFLCWQWISHQR